jgi:ribonuclease HI
VEIGQHDVEFVSRRAIKSQTLADFIAEWTDSGLRGIDELPDHWVMYFDGSYTLKGAGAGVVLIPPEGDILNYAIQLEFTVTNNIVEYERLVNGLRLAKDLGIRRLLVRGDSQLVAKQVQKEYDCNNDMMVEYLAQKCTGWRSSLMDLKYGMSHVWTTVMPITWPGLLPPRHQPHQMSLWRDYPSLRWNQKNQSVKRNLS